MKNNTLHILHRNLIFQIEKGLPGLHWKCQNMHIHKAVRTSMNESKCGKIKSRVGYRVMYKINIKLIDM